MKKHLIKFKSYILLKFELYKYKMLDKLTDPCSYYTRYELKFIIKNGLNSILSTLDLYWLLSYLNYLPTFILSSLFIIRYLVEFLSTWFIPRLNLLFVKWTSLICQFRCLISKIKSNPIIVPTIANVNPESSNDVKKHFLEGNISMVEASNFFLDLNIKIQELNQEGMKLEKFQNREVVFKNLKGLTNRESILNDYFKRYNKLLIEIEKVKSLNHRGFKIRSLLFSDQLCKQFYDIQNEKDKYIGSRLIISRAK
uniref:Uncharacterized protein n=2 Tax=Aspergillus TaxID=5052 RepID=A0A097KZS3_ASPUT|nr:hypothetical protein [Aspergillus ustus]YP_009133192.1 hypothetical protein [Aspergillus flavus]AIT99574.1 hypothetical protein [Aspergillus ustus]AKC59225.1 hypothetical protein [Aspergillus flavus]